MSDFEYNNQQQNREGEYHYSYTDRYKKPKKQERKFGWGALISVALCSALLCGIITSGSMYYLLSSRESSFETGEGDDLSGISSGTTITNQTTNITVSETVNSVAQAVAEKCNASVVGIRVTTQVTTTGIFGQQSTSQSQSDGSGVVYSKDGYIITNYHVIADAVENANYGSVAKGAEIRVYLTSDTENGEPASVVGYDASADIALLKIDKTGLPAVELGNSDELDVGQYAVAIGAPGGLDYMGSVSMGIVSGLDRSITTESGVQMNLIQTDASINPGNSGGALLDENGRLIGINNAKMSGTNYDGMGFAIPVNEVDQICRRLISQEGGQQAYLGVTINTYYTSDRLQSMGYPSGVVVYSVAEDSPAAAAGLKQGDLLTEFNGTAITSYAAMISEKNKYNAGDTVTIKFVRNRQYQTVKVTLE